VSEESSAPNEIKIWVKNLIASYGREPDSNRVLHGITMNIPRGGVTAIIGPSGCGKSTFIRCLNRMHEQIEGASQTGEIRIDDVDINSRAFDPVLLRRRIGMVFQRPNPFPTMSIRENVLAGFALTGRKISRSAGNEIVEKALRRAALWDEVKDRLDARGGSMSGGQQQRLCIARAVAVEPEVLLMDEPCSALDPIATARIEELVRELREDYTIVMVTHNMQQAARVSDRTAFFLRGDLVEFDVTTKIFTNPADTRTEDYITGKFG
jgi:phosphate transport system ATP-binding protein